MTQTARGQKNSPQRSNRPGQRQQERLMRLARRRRRQRIWTGAILGVVLIAAAGLGYWQFQRIQAQDAASAAMRHASVAATATATAPIGPTCATASSVPAAYASTPKAGPSSPPAVSESPAKNADGLQCLNLKVGSGALARTGSTVAVEYTGWLQSNGKKFDSSYDRGAQPFSVTPLGQAQVIQGWNEGLVGMKAGGIRRLIIPPALGYGAQANQAIPANSTLVFDIIILSVS